MPIRGIPQVKEEESNICAYSDCFYFHRPTEGYSEMHEDGTCHIWCTMCGREYFYIDSMFAPRKRKWRV